MLHINPLTRPPSVLPTAFYRWMFILLFLICGGWTAVQATSVLPTDLKIPNQGDGNQDGIPDLQQAHVASLPDKVTGQYLTLELDPGCAIGDIYTDLVGTLPDDDQKYSFAQGLLYFTAHCTHTTVRLYFHGLHTLDPQLALRKYGPTTPGEANTTSWYLFPNTAFDTVTIAGQPVVRATYTLTDGQFGDDTGIDGLIVDSVAATNGTDVDNVVGFLTKSYTASTPQGTAIITVNRAGTQGALTIDYATLDDTALSGQDYQTTTGTLSWADGEQGDQTFTVNLLDTATAGRAFTVSLNNLTGGGTNPTVGINLASVTLTSEMVTPPADSTNFVSFAANHFYALNSDGTATVTVYLSRNNGSGAVTVNYLTKDQTALADTDYQPTSGTLHWAEGEWGNKTVTINLLSGATGGRVLEIALSDSTSDNAISWGVDTATITIVDQNTTPTVTVQEVDNLVSFSTKNQSASRQAEVATFIVNRNGTQGTVSVDYITYDGSALADQDYLATSGTLTWAEGERGDKSVPVTLINSAAVGTTFSMQLSNLLVDGQPTSQALLGIPTSSLLITDDAVPPPVSAEDESLIAFVTKGYTLFKTDGSATLKVHRSGSTAGELTIDYVTEDGTAVAGQDYSSGGGSLFWADGEGGEKSLTVTALASATAGHALMVKLSNLTGATGKITVDTAVLTILESPTNSGITTPTTDDETTSNDTDATDGNNDGIGAITERPTSDISSNTDQGQIYNAGGQPLPSEIGQESSISYGIIDRDTQNGGLLSNLRVLAGVTLTGGRLTGTILNQGTLRDIEFLGVSLSGGTLAGTILNNSLVGGVIRDVILAPGTNLSGGKLGGFISAAPDSTISNVELMPNTTIDGGILAGEIRGTPGRPGTLTRNTFSPGTILAHVTVTSPVEWPDSVQIGAQVTLPSADELAVNNVLAPTQIQNLDAETLSTLPPEAISELTPDQIQDIPPPAFSGLTPDHTEELSQAAVASVTSEQVTHIPPPAFSALEADQVAVIQPATMSAVSGEQLAEIPASSFSGLNAEQMATVQKDTLAALTPAQFLYVPPASLGGLTSDNLGGLSPAVINQFTTTEVKTLQPDAVKNMPDAEAGKLLVNLDTNKVKKEDATTLVPPDWKVDDSGALIPPAGTPLTFREVPPPKDLSPLVVIPLLPNLDSSFGIGGQGGATAAESITQTLQQTGLEASLSQTPEGIVQIEANTAKLSLMCPNGNITQGDTQTPPTVTLIDGGFYQVTAPAARQFTMVPVSKDPENLSQVLEGSNIIVGYRGDVFLEEPSQTRDSDRAREVVIFDPLIEPSPAEFCEEVAGEMVCDFTLAPPELQPGIHEVLDTQPRQKAGTTTRRKKRVVYSDGTSQIVQPTVLAPDTFIQQVQALSEDNQVTFQADGTFKLVSQGQSYLLIPSFTVKSRELQKGEEIEPSVVVNEEGHFIYTIALDRPLVVQNTRQTGRAREVLVFDLLREPFP